MTMTGTARITSREFATIAGLMRQLSGVNLAESKRAMVAARLARRVRALGLEGFGDYCALLTSDAGTAERQEMIQALTTNTTRFNRERRQIDHFADELLPDLVTRARAGGRVRIWSAGCSSGEEPYSLAFRVLDQCQEAATLDFKILATDIDVQILRQAQAGDYPRAGLDALDDQHLRRYFAAAAPGVFSRRVGEEARALISFRLSNLLDRWPFSGPFDVIMCRNVFIYFDRATQDRLWPRMAAMLAVGGVLYIGHSETIGAPERLGLHSASHGVFRMQGQPPQTATADIAKSTGAG